MPRFSPYSARPILRASLQGNAMSATVIAAAAVAGVGAYTLYSRSTKSSGMEPKGVFSSFGFNSLRLHTSELVNHDTKRLRFELPDPNAKTGLSLTSAVLTIAFPNGGWIPSLRPYTPVNGIDDKGFLELLVKHYPGGKQSTHLHSLKPGDTLTFAPIKSYAWTPNQHPHVALIAGGAGITPIYQLTQGILNNADDKTRITLVWGVNNDEDVFLKEQFADLRARFPGRFNTVYAVTNPGPQSTDTKGRVTKEVLEAAGLGAAQRGSDDVKVFVCGPPAMETALCGTKGWGGAKTSGILGELGFTPAQIHRF